MSVFLIADIKVTDDGWIPEYAVNVHIIVENTVGSTCLAAETSKRWKGQRKIVL